MSTDGRPVLNLTGRLSTLIRRVARAGQRADPVDSVDARLVVGTTFCTSELARVRVLQESLVRHEPDARLVGVLLDDVARIVDEASELFLILRPEDLIDEGTLDALCWNDDPALLAARLREPAQRRLRGPTMAWLPADAVVTGPLNPAVPEAGWEQPAEEGDHAAALARHGHAAVAKIPYGRGLLGRGDYIGGILRKLAQDFRAAHPDRASDRHALTEWLRTPAAGGAGARHGVTRFLLDLWNARPDLQGHFPDLDGDDGPLLIEWAWRYGTELDGILEVLLPPRPDPAAFARPYGTPPPLKQQLPHGVNLVGLLERELGLGEAARHTLTALDAAGVPVVPIEARSTMALVRSSVAGSTLGLRHAVYPITLLCLNGPLLNVIVGQIGADFFTHRFTAAIWFWEVGPPPESWFAHARLLDEIWVVSEFMAESLRQATDLPVRVVPQAVEVEAPPRLDLSPLGLEQDTFMFFFMFDHNSDLQRKNPIGLIDAYSRAFPDDGRTALVLKSINGDRRPAQRDRLRLASSGRSDIRLVDELMEPWQRDALIAGCDCYVSLHRSEGFGLTLAEAMLYERPVIASRYGGNLEFMDDENSLLVDVRPAVVSPGSVYPEGGAWADPDLDHAATLMRAVIADPSGAQRRAKLGAATIRERHAPDVVGRVLRDELERARGVLGADGRRPSMPIVELRAAEMASLALAEARRQRRRITQLERRLLALGELP